MSEELMYVSDAKEAYKRRKEVIERTELQVRSIVTSVNYAVKRAIQAGERQTEVETQLQVQRNTPFNAELLSELENEIITKKGFKMKLTQKSVKESDITADGGPGESYSVPYWSLFVSGWAEN